MVLQTVHRFELLIGRSVRMLGTYKTKPPNRAWVVLLGGGRVSTSNIRLFHQALVPTLGIHHLEDRCQMK